MLGLCSSARPQPTPARACAATPRSDWWSPCARAKPACWSPIPLCSAKPNAFAEARRLRGLDAPAEQAVAEALVVARMVHPSSEHAAHAWLAGSSATLDLLGLERAKPLSLSKLYRTSDLLWKHREALETAFAQRERSLFDTPAAIVFYDLTNVHYHGRPGGDMQFGRSKQKRSGGPVRSRRWSWTRACRQRRTWPGCARGAIRGSRCSAADETHLRVWSQQRQQKDEAIVVRRRERFEAEVPGAARGAGPQGLHEALRQGAGTAGTAQGTLPASRRAV